MKNFRKITAAMAISVGISGCDVAYPVAVIGDNGMVFRGSATNTFLEGGAFHATNGKAVCSGRFQQYQDIKTVSFPVACNNGLTGVGTAFFESATRGSGFVTMSDGSRWQFLFGRDAMRI